jgi:hypothetical protein
MATTTLGIFAFEKYSESKVHLTLQRISLSLIQIKASNFMYSSFIYAVKCSQI